MLKSLLPSFLAFVLASSERWHENQANKWYDDILATNYTPPHNYTTTLNFSTLTVYGYIKGWAQSPAASALYDSTQYPRLEAYVKDVVGTFANDDRILAWDMWNEPDNTGLGNYREPANKTAYVNFLLPQTFQWARAANPSQPLTSGLHNSDYYHSGNLNPTEKIQVDNSDIITFHRYDPPSEFELNVKFLQQYNRPILCTEYMARPAGSQFSTILPLGRKYKIGMINWGFVNGKSQTSYPWDSWFNDYLTFPNWVWFHDVFRTDGTPYMLEEVNVIKRIKCQAGWYKSTTENKCYKLMDMTMDWSGAEVMCRNQGGTIVSVENSLENAEITKYITQSPNTCGGKFYIGYVAKALFGQGKPTDWYWYNHSNSTYLNWKSGNPLNDQESFCVVLNQNDGTWTNQVCDIQQCHVCQIALI